MWENLKASMIIIPLISILTKYGVYYKITFLNQAQIKLKSLFEKKISYTIKKIFFFVIKFLSLKIIKIPT